jgi:hypothetical protein
MDGGASVLSHLRVLHLMRRQLRHARQRVHDDACGRGAMVNSSHALHGRLYDARAEVARPGMWTERGPARLVLLLLLAVGGINADIALDAPHISDLTLLLPPASAGRVEAPLVGYHGCFSWCGRRLRSNTLAPPGRCVLAVSPALIGRVSLAPPSSWTTHDTATYTHSLNERPSVRLYPFHC